MLDEPQLIQTEAQPAAVIRFSIPRAQIREVMGPAMQEVIRTAITQGIGPVGPLFSHHSRMEPEMFHFEVGVPVSSEVKPTGRVVASELPAVRVMRTIYHGGYEGLGEAWGEFIGQLEGAGHKLAPNLWERYLTNPDETPDPADYQTELNRPIL